MLDRIICDIKKYSTEVHKKFCETAYQIVEGGYGEEDICVGTKTPILRRFAAEYCDIADDVLVNLLTHKIHEARFLALLIMIDKFQIHKKRMYDLYINHLQYVNNWDLVDLSAHKIIGVYAYQNNDLSAINKCATSENLWQNRIAIVSSFAFIKNGSFDLIFQLAEKFLNHNNTLIARALGWMLREVGKRDLNAMITFMSKYKNMKNITKSYAMECVHK